MQNPREIRGSKWSKAVYFESHFGQNRASLGAFEFILIESVLESGPKRPHPGSDETRPLA